MFVRGICIFALVLSVSFIAKAEDDVESTLGVARFQRLSKLGEATDALSDTMDAKIREVAQTGDFQAVKTLQAEKKKFEENDVLPSSEALSSAVDTYLASRKAASTDLVRAYRTAIAEYTKQLKIDKAESLDKEMKRFIDEERKVFNKSVAQAKPSASVLSKAKTTFKSEVDAAGAKVKETISGLARAATKRGNFKQANYYNSVVKHFETHGSLPDTQMIPVQNAKKDLATAKKKAADKLSASYNQIIARYEEAGQNSEVAKLKSELAKLVASAGDNAAATNSDTLDTGLNKILVSLAAACNEAQQAATLGEKRSIESTKIQKIFKDIEGQKMVAKYRVRSVTTYSDRYRVYLSAAEETIGTGIYASSMYMYMNLPRDIALNLAADDILVVSGRLDLETEYESNDFPAVMQLGRIRGNSSYSSYYYLFLRNVTAQFHKGN